MEAHPFPEPGRTESARITPGAYRVRSRTGGEAEDAAAAAGRMEAARGRLAGYRKDLEQSGIAVDGTVVAEGDFSEESGRRAMRELLERRPDLDAVLAASDVMASDVLASGALQVLREAGRSVPGDVTLIGCDDSVIARHTDPPLTSVRQPIVEMGRTMARLLLDEIAEPARLRRQVVLPPNWWDGVRVALGRCRPCRLIPRLAMTAR